MNNLGWRVTPLPKVIIMGGNFNCRVFWLTNASLKRHWGVGRFLENVTHDRKILSLSAKVNKLLFWVRGKSQ